MERFSYSLATELARIGHARTLANRSGKKALPVFVGRAIIGAALAARRGDCDIVHLGDALLAPAGSLIKAITGLPVTATIHGLDITFDNPAYHAVLHRTIVKLDRIIAVSESTRAICLGRWPDLQGKVVVVPNGVEVRSRTSESCDLPAELAETLEGHRILLTVGRLVRRKGVAWFVDKVLPRLPEDAVYLVVGDGPDRARIHEAAAHRGLGSRVQLLGRISDETLEAVYQNADVFVMPNILVENDVEGFGLVALEAAIRGLPVVASNLQGIPDAIHEGSNGFLLPVEDTEAYTIRIRSLLSLSAVRRRAIGEKFAHYTSENFSWRQTALGYWRELESVIAKSRHASHPVGEVVDSATTKVS
jgi:glycosyltransferase involved in cell wall biosynthesis